MWGYFFDVVLKKTTVHYTSPASSSAEIIISAADYFADSELSKSASRIVAFSQSLTVGESKLNNSAGR
jgi:hypothetical protein